MREQNPYVAPNSHSIVVEQFEPELLPIIFAPSLSWKIYWLGMDLLSVVATLMQLYSAIIFPSLMMSVLTLVGICSFFFMLTISYQALTSEIELSAAGMRIDLHKVQFDWSEVVAWSQDKRSVISIRLKDSRSFDVVGQAATVERKAIIKLALVYYCGPEDS